MRRHLRRTCCGRMGRRCMPQSYLHVVFLVSFVLFLVVGTALTALGFLGYGAGGPTTRAFRILGVVALLLCIGFLIAACVVVSECITAAIRNEYDLDDAVDDLYGYRALRPMCSESFAAEYNQAYAASPTRSRPPSSHDSTNFIDRPTAIPIGRSSTAIALGICPSCSCQLVQRPSLIRLSAVTQSMSYPSAMAKLTKPDNDVIAEHQDRPALALSHFELDSDSDGDADSLHGKEWV